MTHEYQAMGRRYFWQPRQYKPQACSTVHVHVPPVVASSELQASRQGLAIQTASQGARRRPLPARAASRPRAPSSSVRRCMPAARRVRDPSFLSRPGQTQRGMQIRAPSASNKFLPNIAYSCRTRACYGSPPGSQIPELKLQFPYCTVSQPRMLDRQVGDSWVVGSCVARGDTGAGGERICK